MMEILPETISKDPIRWVDVLISTPRTLCGLSVFCGGHFFHINPPHGAKRAEMRRKI
jgi:hypothetical protein